MFAWRSLVCVLGCCAAVAAMGCENNGNLATVSGVVTHGGSPVEGAKVEFHGTTEQEGGGRDIFAVYTDSSGKYLVAGKGQTPGIPPGMYRVAISKYEGDVALTGPESGMDAGQLDAQVSDMGAGAPMQKEIKNHLPKQYASPDTSKLSATVESGKNENVNFELE